MLRNWFEDLKTSCGLNCPRQTRRRSPLRKRHDHPFFQAAEVCEERRLLSAGALDPTFGSGGVAAPSAAINGTAAAIAVYSNASAATAGDVVAAGNARFISGRSTYYDFALVRYTANGGPDLSFGKNGEVTTAFKSFTDSEAQAVAIQGDGKIVAAGYAGGNGSANFDFALARYNVNGTLDSGFGSSGQVTTNFTGSKQTASFDEAGAAIIQADGKIVLAGVTCSRSHPADNNVALARYNANGTLDTTFGSGGKVITSHAAIPGSLVNSEFGTHVVDVALQADGKILVGGYTQVAGATESYEAFVARYNPNGTLDTSFGANGFVTLPPVQVGLGLGPADPLGRLAVEQSGEIVVNGTGQLALLHSGQAGYADGSLDTSFGSAGIVSTLPYMGGPVALEPNGAIVFGVGTHVARFLPDGTPDSNFGNGGVVTLSSSLNFAALAIQPDGRIDLAGDGFVVDRLLPDEPQIGSLTTSVNPVAAGSGVTAIASNITDDNPGATITGVAFYVDSNGDGVLDAGDSQLVGTLTRSNGRWALTFSTAGWTPGSYTLFAQATDSYGVLGDSQATSLKLL
jgi:uncharacterized delta-60 repeat protein